MKLAGEQLAKAGPVAIDLDVFRGPAQEVANAMKATRDLYSPDPAFYQLADEAFQYATQSIQEREPGLRALAWNNTQSTCQQCHLRYGGPKTYPEIVPSQ
jgi:hypothetical protein